MKIHQKKAGPDHHRLKTMVKRSIEQNLRIKNFEARNGNYERNAVVKNEGTKQRGQRTLGDCWQWESNGQCSTGDNCSFRHDINTRAKMTQPNPSPSCFMQQNETNTSRTRSPRGKSPSGRMSRWPCKDYLKGTCTNSFCEKVAPSRMLVLQDQEWFADLGKSALTRIARLKNSRLKGLKRMMTQVQWLCWKLHDTWVAYFRIWSRRSLHRFFGRAQLSETDPTCEIHKSRCTSRRHSRPKSIAWNDLPRWSSSA